MNSSQQRQNEACHKHNEAIVARHLHQLFRHLPTLSGFWLDGKLEVTEVVYTSAGYTADHDFYHQVVDLLVQVAAECPDAVQLMRGRTFARTVH